MLRWLICTLKAVEKIPESPAENHLMIGSRLAHSLFHFWDELMLFVAPALACFARKAKPSELFKELKLIIHLCMG